MPTSKSSLLTFLIICLSILITACQKQETSLPTLMVLPTEDENMLEQTLDSQLNLSTVAWEIIQNDVKAYACDSTNCDSVLTLQSGNVIDVSTTENGWHLVINGTIRFYIEEKYTQKYISEPMEDTAKPASTEFVTSMPTLTLTPSSSPTITNTTDPLMTASLTFTLTSTVNTLATDTSLTDNTNGINESNSVNVLSTSETTAGNNSGGSSIDSGSNSGVSPTNTPVKRTTYIISTAIPTATEEVLQDPIIPTRTPDVTQPEDPINIATATLINANVEPVDPINIVTATLINANAEPVDPIVVFTPTLIGADIEPIDPMP